MKAFFPRFSTRNVIPTRFDVARLTQRNSVAGNIPTVRQVMTVSDMMGIQFTSATTDAALVMVTSEDSFVEVFPPLFMQLLDAHNAV